MFDSISRSNSARASGGHVLSFSLSPRPYIPLPLFSHRRHQLFQSLWRVTLHVAIQVMVFTPLFVGFAALVFLLAVR
jgi:hypothetical protein